MQAGGKTAPRPSQSKAKFKSKHGKPQSDTAGGIDRQKLTETVGAEMEALRLFIKEVKGTRTNEPDYKLKSFYRDKYKQKYLGEDGSGPTHAVLAKAPAEQLASTGPSPGQRAPSAATPTRTKPGVGTSLSRREVDWAVSNSDKVAEQVGNNGSHFTNQIPDGWDCGYTYKYAKDSCPPSARGVPLPATFGGGGGGGKYVQVLQDQGKDTDSVYHRKIYGREPPQHTKEWVTWASHDARALGHTVYGAGDVRAPLAFVSPGGKVVAVDTHKHGGSGKRGRNAAVDEYMSQRGGESNFAPLRMGAMDSERAGGWYSPSFHNSNSHDPLNVRTDPVGSLHSEKGKTALGGGKKGRNPAKEYHQASTNSELWKSPQSKPQMGSFGTSTGGGSKGRSPAKDREQSSNPGGLW